MKTSTNKALIGLKAILAVYIILCLIIAGLKYGYAPHASKTFAQGITWFWHFYENWIKTFFIIICSLLTLKVISTSKYTTMRKHNLIGLIIAALIVHIILPLFLHNGEVYVFDMPLPWTTSPLQLMYTHSEFYERNFPIWGIPGITGILIFYFSISLLVFIGTLLFGRRLQCATLCLFNGFASEVFGSAIPIVGKQKKVGPKMLKVFNLLRWISFIIALFFTLWWIQFLVRLQLDPSTQAPAHLKLVTKLESIKYLSCELLMAMFFWVAYVGRAYCYYCPLGTLLGLISKLAGQRISTQNSHCVGCNQCNKACPMSLDIKAHAQEHTDLSSLRCVGCGHCIDACPTQNLSYTTHFLDHLHHRLPHQKRISL